MIGKKSYLCWLHLVWFWFLFFKMLNFLCCIFLRSAYRVLPCKDGNARFTTVPTIETIVNRTLPRYRCIEGYFWIKTRILKISNIIISIIFRSENEQLWFSKIFCKFINFIFRLTCVTCRMWHVECE